MKFNNSSSVLHGRRLPISGLLVAGITLFGLIGCSSADTPDPLPTAVETSSEQTNIIVNTVDNREENASQDNEPNFDLNAAQPATKDGVLDSLEQTAPTPLPNQEPLPTPTEAAAYPQPNTNPEPEGPLPEVGTRVGNLAPDFTLQTLDGGTLSMADLRGQTILLNYWATWCPPCIEELGYFEDFQQEFAAMGFQVVAINGIEQDNLGDVHTTVAETGLTYPVLLDHDELIWRDYQVQFMPTTFYIDERGIIRGIQLGSASEEDFREKITGLIAGEL